MVPRRILEPSAPRQVADNLTLAQAAEELQKQCTANSAANGENQDSFVPGIETGD